MLGSSVIKKSIGPLTAWQRVEKKERQRLDGRGRQFKNSKVAEVDRIRALLANVEPHPTAGALTEVRGPDGLIAPGTEAWDYYTSPKLHSISETECKDRTIHLLRPCTEAVAEMRTTTGFARWVDVDLWEYVTRRAGVETVPGGLMAPPQLLFCVMVAVPGQDRMFGRLRSYFEQSEGELFRLTGRGVVAGIRYNTHVITRVQLVCAAALDAQSALEVKYEREFDREAVVAGYEEVVDYLFRDPFYQATALKEMMRPIMSMPALASETGVVGEMYGKAEKGFSGYTVKEYVPRPVTIALRDWKLPLIDEALVEIEKEVGPKFAQLCRQSVYAHDCRDARIARMLIDFPRTWCGYVRTSLAGKMKNVTASNPVGEIKPSPLYPYLYEIGSTYGKKLREGLEVDGAGRLSFPSEDTARLIAARIISARSAGLGSTSFEFMYEGERLKVSSTSKAIHIALGGRSVSIDSRIVPLDSITNAGSTGGRSVPEKDMRLIFLVTLNLQMMQRALYEPIASMMAQDPDLTLSHQSANEMLTHSFELIPDNDLFELLIGLDYSSFDIAQEYDRVRGLYDGIKDAFKGIEGTYFGHASIYDFLSAIFGKGVMYDAWYVTSEGQMGWPEGFDPTNPDHQMLMAIMGIFAALTNQMLSGNAWTLVFNNLVNIGIFRYMMARLREMGKFPNMQHTGSRFMGDDSTHKFNFPTCPTGMQMKELVEDMSSHCMEVGFEVNPLKSEVDASGYLKRVVDCAKQYVLTPGMPVITGAEATDFGADRIGLIKAFTDRIRAKVMRGFSDEVGTRFAAISARLTFSFRTRDGFFWAPVEALYAPSSWGGIGLHPTTMQVVAGDEAYTFMSFDPQYGKLLQAGGAFLKGYGEGTRARDVADAAFDTGVFSKGEEYWWGLMPAERKATSAVAYERLKRDGVQNLVPEPYFDIPRSKVVQALRDSKALQTFRTKDKQQGVERALSGRLQNPKIPKTLRFPGVTFGIEGWIEPVPREGCPGNVFQGLGRNLIEVLDIDVPGMHAISAMKTVMRILQSDRAYLSPMTEDQLLALLRDPAVYESSDRLLDVLVAGGLGPEYAQRVVGRVASGRAGLELFVSGSAQLSQESVSVYASRAKALEYTRGTALSSAFTFVLQSQCVSLARFMLFLTGRYPIISAAADLATQRRWYKRGLNLKD
jgi:hypothetical protein